MGLGWKIVIREKLESFGGNVSLRDYTLNYGTAVTIH